MDTENPVVKLCVEGMSLEAEGRLPEAAKSFLQAWQIASDDFEASVAAHYVARHQNSPAEAFVLRWTPDQPVPPTANGYVPAPDGPSVFTAVEEQLGLKLEPTRGPVKTLVIEHIERPTEN